MESKNKLHIKISSRTIAFLYSIIFILFILIFLLARDNIKKGYIKKLDTPGQLIENQIVPYEIINNRDFISSIIEEDIVYCAIIGKHGKIHYSTSKSLIGKDSWNIIDLHVAGNKSKNSGFFKNISEKYKYFIRTKKLYNDKKEEIGLLYIKTKKQNFRNTIQHLIILYSLSIIIVLSLVYVFISRLIKKKVSNPLHHLLSSSKELNKGNLSFELKKVNSNDEFEILEEHNNQFVLGLREKTKFADEIEKKNFNFEYSPLSDKDELGKALVELRNSLKKATEEEETRKKLDETNSWITNGVAKFSEILRKDVVNMEQLGYSVISNLVEYLGANQGGFFLIEEESKTEKVIELKAAYALNRKKHFERKLAWGEGIIGSCLLEGKPTYLTNLPEDYINISSGLGEANPRALLIVPLQSGKTKYGVLEIASFKPFEDHHLDLVNRISEIIASTISTVRNNIKTQELLQETQEQSEKIKQAEEELRQNIEEMHATQEEVERANNELRKNEAELTIKAAELEKEKYLMDALMENVPEYIYFKDKEGKFLKNSKSHANALGVNSPEELVDKSDFDFFSNDHAKPAFDDEQKIISTNKPIIDHIEKETHNNGGYSWVTTTKMPLRNAEGEIVGTFGISKDITTIKDLEEEAVRSKQDLEFENILFTTLMDNIAARITFKDTEAKYIRINQTKMKALGVKDQSEIMGKTDIDIFGDSHSKKALQNEIKNIKEGLSVFDNVEEIKYKNGNKSWGSTSRIPIVNSDKEILGGLVITWDITDRKNSEFELEMLKSITDSIFNDFPIVYFNLDSNKQLTNITGKGIENIGITTNGDFLKLFPEILKSIDKLGNDNTTQLEGTITIDKKNIPVKHFIGLNKMTTNGYSGYTIINK